jgi:hypothetical protein
LKLGVPASFTTLLRYDALPRPHYGYGVYQAALQARALGLPAISAIEFGVAGGQGLIELERVGDLVRQETGVEVKVYGFGLAKGMPVPVDHRDMSYVWAPGLFRMPLKRIRSQLKRGELVLGDVRNTVPTFREKFSPPPIGFVAFDLDYHSSTMAAFGLFDGPTDSFLPRVFCYFDDIIGDDAELHGPFAGELAAIEDFNRDHASRKISQIFGLRHKRLVASWWNDVMFVMHAFDHPRYNEYINPRWKAPAAKSATKPEVVVRPGLNGTAKAPTSSSPAPTPAPSAPAR